jgi:transposase
MTHDYKRHGTTTLFAAPSVLDGTVIGRCMRRHRRREFIRFLNAVEREVAAGKLIHVILDNYATHKHPKVLAWLSRHPRRTFHFTPTSASWHNAVENFFSKMTRQRIRRGVFRSIADLQVAINAYVAEHIACPKPFLWTNLPTRSWPNSTASLHHLSELLGRRRDPCELLSCCKIDSPDEGPKSWYAPMGRHQRRGGSPR